MTDPRWGLTLPFAGVPLADHGPHFQLAEELGYDDLWTGETAGADGFTPLALAAVQTERMRLEVQSQKHRSPWKMIAVVAGVLVAIFGGVVSD